MGKEDGHGLPFEPLKKRSAMANQFAVLHVEKCKGNLTGLGQHIDRIKIPSNADPARQEQNAHFVSNDKPLTEDVNALIASRYKGKKALRSDAVKALKFVLTGSHERMVELSRDPKQMNAWLTANAQFLIDKFGAGNTVRLSLHMDERTPHLHAVVVPLTKDGRLSAKEMLGGPAEMKQLQSDYAEAMKPFGLERGLENSPAKHTDIREFYAMVNHPEALLPNVPEKGFVESAASYRQKLAKIFTPVVAEAQQFRRMRRSFEESIKQLKERLEDAIKDKLRMRNVGVDEGKQAERKRINAILAPHGVKVGERDELLKIDPKNDQKRDQGRGL